MATAGRCEEHPNARVVGKCVNCGKPVCMECFQARGYLCSEACREAVKSREPATDDTSPVSADEIARLNRRSDAVAFWVFKGGPLVVATLVVLFLGIRFLDRSGKERWVLTVPGSAHFTATSVSDGTLYVLRDNGFCQAVDVGSGSERWHTRLAGREEDGPDSASYRHSPFADKLLATNGLVVCYGYDEVTVLDASRGKQLWRHELTGWSGGQFAFGGNRMLVVDRRSGSGTRTRTPPDQASVEAMIRRREESIPHLVCMDMRSGSELWIRPYADRDITDLAIAGEACYCVSCSSPRFEWKPCPKHMGHSAREMGNCPNCTYEWSEASDYEVNVMRASDGAPYFSSRLATGSIAAVYLLADCIVLVTTEQLYILTPEGERRATHRFTGKLWKAGVSGSTVVAGLEDGKLQALSTRDGRILWERTVEGRAWDLQVVPGSVYVTAGIPADDAAVTHAGSPSEPRALTPQEKLMREFTGQFGPDSGMPLPEERIRATLINYKLSSGKERWRDAPFAGSVTALPCGHLQLLQGGAAAMSFVHGTGAVLTEHRRRNGKPCWKFKVKERIDAMTVGPETVFVICNPGTGLFGPWSRDTAGGSKIRAIRRRTMLNRLRKL